VNWEFAGTLPSLQNDYVGLAAISLAYHHGLRVSELIALRWNAIDWKRADIAVNRLKGSKSNRQPLDGGDLRVLRALYRERTSDEWVFVSERGPFTRDGFAKMLKATARRCNVDWPI